MPATYIPVPQSNRLALQLRRGVDLVAEGAAILKRTRALIETMVDGSDYTVAAAQFGMPAADIQAAHQLLIASEALSGSDAFATLVTRLG